MPINTSYGSAIGVIHADGSVASSSIKYDWNGSVFVKTVGPETGLIDASIALIFGQRIANDINAGNVYKYSPDLDPSTAFLSPIQIAVLRLAIDAGTTTAAKAVEVFGNVTITQAFAFAFNAQALPATLTADQEQSVLLADFYGFPLRLRDVLVKPSAYVDSSAHDTASSPWAIPSGTSATTAIATAWATSTVPSIAAAATSTLSGSADATKATPFALTATPYGDLIEKAYLAFFLRPADATGFNYYADKMNASGGDLSLMTAGFGSSPEYLQTYAGFSTAQRINAIYQNLFNRDAEPAGVEYWGSRLDSGTFTINNIAISILVGA
ncbi:MAG: DUF4214 domain-containing protein, partial [Caldisericota bacterium]|nr:DUF4214 domain-containing protein [Caldisericota bacterium]